MTFVGFIIAILFSIAIVIHVYIDYSFIFLQISLIRKSNMDFQRLVLKMFSTQKITMPKKYKEKTIKFLKQ